MVSPAEGTTLGLARSFVHKPPVIQNFRFVFFLRYISAPVFFAPSLLRLQLGEPSLVGSYIGVKVSEYLWFILIPVRAIRENNNLSRTPGCERRSAAL